MLVDALLLDRYMSAEFHTIEIVGSGRARYFRTIFGVETINSNNGLTLGLGIIAYRLDKQRHNLQSADVGPCFEILGQVARISKCPAIASFFTGVDVKANILDLRRRFGAERLRNRQQILYGRRKREV
jgi:hypothetical protein